MSQLENRFHEIDLLRGIACASVVAFHFLSRGPRADLMSQAFYPAMDAVARYGYLGVHLFFVISGFVILMSALGATPREFVASRVARLYPALWVAASITALSAWLLAEPRFIISLPYYLVNLTMVPHWFSVPWVDGAYWSLAVELHFYIFVWFMLKLKQQHRLEWLLIAWLCVSTINAFRPAWPIELWLNAKWAPLFVAGGTFFLIRSRGINILRGTLLLASWILSMHYAVLETESNSIANPLICIYVITAIFAIFLAIAFNRWHMESSRSTRVASALTYPVYVLHQNFGYMFYESFRAETISTPLALCITLLIVILIGWIIHRYVEKTISPRIRKSISGTSVTYPRKILTD